jgi:hypothetical protein
VPALDERGRLAVGEVSGDRAGAYAPFGDDQQLPLPPERVPYHLPARERR